MAYHPNAPPRYVAYRGMKKDGSGWAGWSLGSFVEKSCAACKKRGDSCLRIVVDDFGNVDLGACVWCKARSVRCSTAQLRGRQAKAKGAEGTKGGKRKASEVDSEASEGERPLPKKAKLVSVVEESEEEWEEWNRIQATEEVREDMVTEEIREEVEEVREVVEEVREVTEEVREVAEEVREVAEEVREVDKKEAKRARREARRWERRARRSERADRMDELIDVVRELGNKVDEFAAEVRVSNALRNRADREYLEERRRWYFSDRKLNARNWQEEDSGVDSEGHSV
jgi:uncharacterized protein YoxC